MPPVLSAILALLVSLFQSRPSLCLEHLTFGGVILSRDMASASQPPRSRRGGAVDYPVRDLAIQAMVLAQASFAASCR
jgi:hypothetical protein